MNNLKKWVALLLSLCMLLSLTAIAEETAADAAAITELNDTDVVATLNGVDIPWSIAMPYYNSLVSQYSAYYDMTLQENVDTFRAVAVENAIYEELQIQKATELGLYPLSAEAQATADAEAEAIWESNITSYISTNYPDLTSDSPEADLTAAREAALAYFDSIDYTNEYVHTAYTRSTAMEALFQQTVQDITVTDADVEAYYQDLVAQDKALYENDLDAYVTYNSNVDMNNMYAMYGYAEPMDYAWYRPAGFRGVKHILLSVDETLMTEYQNLLAQLEEQMAAETAETTETTETTSPVTQADVDNAKAAILAASQSTIDEINQRLANGEDFEALITEYTMDSDSLYEVSVASTATYVPEFVEAAFSVDNVGDVSAPYISQYGIHIVKYISDIPAGPIEMTDDQRASMMDTLLTTRQDDKYTEAVDSWLANATIEYTGLVISYDELLNQMMAEEAAAEEAALAEETATEEATTEEAATEEAATEEAATEEATTEPAAE